MKDCTVYASLQYIDRKCLSMRFQIQFILSLLFGYLLTHSLPGIAQNITAIQSGNWHNPSTWDTGAIPTDTDTVYINNGHEVYLPEDASASVCAKLVVEDSASSLILHEGDLTVLGTTLIRRGQLMDTAQLGVNRFNGHVLIDRGGSWYTPNSKPSKMIFGGGITSKGDTIFLGGCRFEGNDQELNGSLALIATDDIVIGTGVSLTNNINQGIYLDRGNLTGQDQTSTFVNLRRLYYQGNTTPMEEGQVDFSAPGNTVYYVGYGDQVIREGSYDKLEIQVTPELTESQKTLRGDVTVNSDFYLDKNTILDLAGHSLYSNGEGEIQGVLLNSEPIGSANFADLTLFAARLDGNEDIPLTVNISGNLLNPKKNSQANHIHLSVGDTLIVGSKRTFFFNGNCEVELTHVYVEQEGDLFLKAAPGSTYLFNGKITLDGQMNLRSGHYTFRDTLVLRDSAFFQAKDDQSTYIFEKPIVCNGTFGHSSGMFIFADDLLGSQPIFISDSLWVQEGATVVNRNTGGLHSRGELNGLGESSVFQNAGTLVLESENHFESPMETGTFDLNTHPGNTIIFGSGAKDQPIPSGTYYNLGIDRGRKVIVGGNVEVKGDFMLNQEAKSEEGLDQYKVILLGEGDQTLTANSNGKIEAMEISKAGGKVLLGSEFEISGILVMTSGVVETGAYTLSLGTSGQIEESKNSYIIGKVATRRSVGANQGRQFGGLGLKIKASPDNALGETLVIRTTGEYYEAGQIDRYFEIFPANNSNLNASVDFIYEDRDITGAIELDLFLVHSEGGENFVLWEESGIAVETNVLSQKGINSFGILSAKSVNIPISAYPSPLYDGNLTIDYVLPAENITFLNVFDRSGRSIANHRFVGYEGKNSFKLTDLQLGAGIFFVRIKSGRLKGYQTFVKVTP